MLDLVIVVVFCFSASDSSDVRFPQMFNPPFNSSIGTLPFKTVFFFFLSFFFIIITFYFRKYALNSHKLTVMEFLILQKISICQRIREFIYLFSSVSSNKRIKSNYLAPLNLKIVTTLDVFFFFVKLCNNFSPMVN